MERACLTGTGLRATSRVDTFKWARAHRNEETMSTICWIYIIQSCGIEIQCPNTQWMPCSWRASNAWEWGPVDGVLVRTDWSKSSAKQAHQWRFQHRPWLYGTWAPSECFQINFSLKHRRGSEVWWKTSPVKSMPLLHHMRSGQKWESKATKRQLDAWNIYHRWLMGAVRFAPRSRTLCAWFRLWKFTGSQRNAE